MQKNRILEDGKIFFSYPQKIFGGKPGGKIDGWKLGESSPQDTDEPYVGSYAAVLCEPSLKGEGEVSNSRMGM